MLKALFAAALMAFGVAVGLSISETSGLERAFGVVDTRGHAFSLALVYADGETKWYDAETTDPEISYDAAWSLVKELPPGDVYMTMVPCPDDIGVQPL